MSSRGERGYPGYASMLELGQLKGRMTAVEDDIKEIKLDIKDINDHIEARVKVINQHIEENTRITNNIQNSLNAVIKSFADREKKEKERKRSFSFWEVTILTTLVSAVITGVLGLLFHFFM